MTRCILVFGFIITAAVFTTVFGAKRKAPKRGFVSTKAAENWEEALASGNGKTGALVMSQPVDETIIFTHERLLMPWYKVLPLVDLSGHIDEIRKLVQAGRYGDAGRLAQDLSHNYGYDVESVGKDMRWPTRLFPRSTCS